jgi:DNA-binding NarL/FixJ family response regulator
MTSPIRVLVADDHPLARAITAVAAGEAILGPAVAARVLAFFATPPRTPTPFPELTTREHEVLDLIVAEGIAAPPSGRSGGRLQLRRNG